MTRGIGFGLAVGVLLSVALPGSLHAATVVPGSGVEFDDAEIFKPTTDPGAFLSVYDSSMLAPGRFSIGSYLDYALDPFAARRRVGGEEENVDVVDHLVSLNVLGAVGLSSRFQLGMHLPLYLTDESDVILGTDERGDTNVNFGDFLVNAKIDLAGSGGRGLGFALLPTIGLPTGNRREFAGLGRFSYGGLLALDYAGERWTFGANFGGMIRDGFGGRDEDDDFEDVMRWAIAASRPVSPALTLVGELYGLTDADQEFHSPVELLGAVRWNVGTVDLTFGAGGGLDDGKNAAAFRLVFGLTAARAAARAVAPVAAPPAAPSFAGPAELASSRKSYVVEDWDRNGQVSPGDVIVYTIAIVNTGSTPIQNVVVTDPLPPNTDYSPSSLSVNGLPLADAAGYQPSPPQIVARIPSIAAGPGSNQALISFKTKIRAGLDTRTTLRNEARIRADGVSEFVLAAVDTAVFPAEARREDVGTTPTVGDQRKLEVTENIRFRPNAAEILPASHLVLDQVVSILREQPELRIQIVGHTDSEGDANANLLLSQERAESVKRHLVDKGIDGSRLQSAGHGESEPVASNATEAGRAANRRVEFLVIGGG